jgi:aldose 1-epimerase
MEFTLEAGDARVTVDPAAGGRVASLEVAGLQLLVPRNDDPLQWGCYPMAPWAGRVRDGKFRFNGVTYDLPLSLPPHAIHGTTFHRAWKYEGDGRLAIDLGDAWPFPGRAVQQISLDSEGLDLRLEVRAESDPFPASVGWHPWFLRRLARGGPAELEFHAESMYERDPAGIPNGRLVPPPPEPWDDCFTDVVSGPSLRWPGALRVSLSSSAAHWVVYSEPEHAICIEPQTGPPDALNIARELVTSENPLVAEARIAWVMV